MMLTLVMYGESSTEGGAKAWMVKALNAVCLVYCGLASLFCTRTVVANFSHTVECIDIIANNFLNFVFLWLANIAATYRAGTCMSMLPVSQVL